ncbi:MAG TPA: type II secretion system protein GspK, partial [Anaerohalosphaeraceae bacterium]|nr:type II secretion system protein GspK [Anaerohalosphaeraceae bacterium]
SSQSSTTTTGQTRSSSQQAGTPPSWQSVLSKADQIAFSSETVLPGKVNVNTAPLMVLYALLEGQRQLAENILAHREGRSVGFATLEDLSQVEGMTETILKQIIDQVDVRSSVFSISSKAVSDATGQTYTLEAILNRDEQNGRFLYWREQQP